MADPALASFGPRLGAAFLDDLILGFASFPIFGVFVLLSDASPGVAGVFLVLALFGLFVVVPGLWAAGRWGGSPGKRAVKITVVPSGAQPMSAGRGIKRQSVKLLGAFCFYLGWLSALWDPQRRAWHDKVADTLVLRKEVAPATAVPHADPAAAPTAGGQSCPVCGFPLGKDGRCTVCGTTA
jgi:uncharacterized RDD family membrane protein YckC